jgi:hypothetical protein
MTLATGCDDEAFPAASTMHRRTVFNQDYGWVGRDMEPREAGSA